MRYEVLYPETENIHLIKDVGMIPFKLNQLYGYKAKVATYNRGPYPYLQEEVSGLELEFIHKKFNNSILDGINYLSQNAKNIDVLQLFHITLRSVIYSFTYKFFNRKGRIFLKLDCTERLIDIIRSMSFFKRSFLMIFLNKVTLIGVEQRKIMQQLGELLPNLKKKMVWVPNGIDYRQFDSSEKIPFEEKENTILTVGRLGSPEKNTKMLVEAFGSIPLEKRKGWNLVLVGPVEGELQQFLQSYLSKNPDLKRQIQIKGAVYDRKILWEEYRKAKIFSLSSNYESFGIALLEGASCGDVIVSTDVGIAGEIVEGGIGKIVAVSDCSLLARALQEMMADDKLKNYSEETVKRCIRDYNWDNIIERLHRNLNA